MTNRFLRGAAILTLLALALMVWSVLQPTPMPVLLAMSLGQALGTAAFAMFGYVVLRDVRRQYIRRRDAAELLKRTSGRMAAVAEVKAILDDPPPDTLASTGSESAPATEPAPGKDPPP